MTLINTTLQEFGIYPKKFLTSYTVILRDLLTNTLYELLSTSTRLERGVIYISIDTTDLEVEKNYYMFVKDPRSKETLWYGKGFTVEGNEDINNYQPFDKENNEDFITL